MRQKFADEGSEVQKDSKTDKSQGAARAISSFIDPGLCWKDIEWFKTITKMPIVLKGVQCWEDAVMAAEAGLAGVVLSNHGGRQLDFARSGIEILVEVMAALKERDLLKNGFEVQCVLLPSSFLHETDHEQHRRWSPTCGRRHQGRRTRRQVGRYRTSLPLRVLRLRTRRSNRRDQPPQGRVRDEVRSPPRCSPGRANVQNSMRLIGAPTLKDLTPDMVDLSNLHSRMVDIAPDHLARANYEPLAGVRGGQSKL